MPAAIALVVTAQARPSQAGGMPRLEVGRLEVEAGLAVEAHPRTPVKHALVVRGPWRPDGGAMVEEMSGPGYSATLRAEPGADGIQLDAVIRYAVPVVIDREAIQLRLPGRARALGRDLAVLQLDHPLRVDRGTPIWLATAGSARSQGVALVGGTGLHAARYAPLGVQTAVDLIIDDAGSHPFSSFVRCRTSYLPHDAGMPIPKHPPPALEKRARHSRTMRAAGAVVRAHATLIPIADGADFLPLVVERWPAGARAAMVFTDHADRTDPLALRAVLFGVSDRRDPAYGKGGFFGHHLRITKTFFASPGVGSLADPDARALADEIAAAGSEVGAHSITPRRDTREIVGRFLARFARWHTATWIDHQPDTNCEAITSHGWRDDPRFGIHDLLAGAGFGWVWSATDVGRFARVQNLFEPERRAAALPPVYPLPADPRLWVFTSSWFYGKADKLAEAMSDQALDQLERERGLFVAHTYLSASPRTTLRRRDLIKRDVVVERADGTFAIERQFDDGLARIGRRVAAGAIASLTLAEAGDRLRALDSIEVEYRADGTAAVHNAGSHPVRGLTLAVPTALTLDARGVRLAGTRSDPARTTVWFDLPAGRTVVLTASRDGTPVRLGAGR
jgi:hypothetical protein